MTLCDPAAGEDIECSDPETYQMEHPLRGESDEDSTVFSENEVAAPGMMEEEDAAVGGESDIVPDSGLK